MLRIARTIAPSFVMVLVAAFLVTPARAEVTSGNDRGVFANADWSWTDQATGSTGYRTIQGSGPRDPSLDPALVSAFGSDYIVKTCPDGTQGMRIVDVEGEGPGNVTVEPAMSGARLEATLDLTTVRTDTCAGTTKTTRNRDARIAVGLSPDGPVRTETSLWSQLVPSISLGRSHVRAVVREGTGWMRFGDRLLRPGWAEFGRIHGVWHVNARADAPVLMALHANRALTTGATDRGSELRAVGTFERYDARSMAVAFVDVLTLPDGTPSVLAAIYRSRAVTCADGSEGSVETLRSAETPGTLRMGAHYRSAEAFATIDLEVVRSNGCTGTARTWTEPGVPVSLTLGAGGPVITGSESIALRTPSMQNAFVRERMRARSAVGSLTIGAVTRETTSGWVGQTWWWIHGVDT
jgi:hypothetical protein